MFQSHLKSCIGWSSLILSHRFFEKSARSVESVTRNNYPVLNSHFVALKIVQHCSSNLNLCKEKIFQVQSDQSDSNATICIENRVDHRTGAAKV